MWFEREREKERERGKERERDGMNERGHIEIDRGSKQMKKRERYTEREMEEGDRKRVRK